MITRRALLAAFLLAGFTACATVERDGGPLIPKLEEHWIRSDLYFGRSRPDGTTVPEAEWRKFVDEEVTPRFPDGLTIVDATGQYRNRSGRIVKEDAKLLVIFHQPSADNDKAIEEIRKLYRRRFDQESVLLIRAGVRVSF